MPVLRQTIRLFDDIEAHRTDKAQDRAQLHTWMRAYGITPDGQLANRWAKPKLEETKASQPRGSQKTTASAASDHYAHLRVVNE